MNTVIGAFIAALILFGSSLLTLFASDPRLTFGELTTAVWVSLIVGGLVAFGKDYQAISTRRAVGKITGSGDGGGSI